MNNMKNMRTWTSSTTLGTSARARLATTRAPLPAASPQSSSGWSAPPPGCRQHTLANKTFRGKPLHWMTQTSPTCELRTSTSSCKWRISCFAPSNSTVVLRRLDTWSQKWCLSFVQVEAYQLWEPAFEAPHSPPPTRNSRSAIASLGTDILSPEKK